MNDSTAGPAVALGAGWHGVIDALAALRSRFDTLTMHVEREVDGVQAARSRFKAEWITLGPDPSPAPLLGQVVSIQSHSLRVSKRYLAPAFGFLASAAAFVASCRIRASCSESAASISLLMSLQHSIAITA